MTESEEIRLQRMGLTKLTNEDTFVEHEEEWECRVTLHDKLKDSDHIVKKPIGNGKIDSIRGFGL